MIIPYRKSQIFSWIKDEKSVNEFIIPSLRNAWKSITGINFKFEKITNEFNDYTIIPDNVTTPDEETILFTIIGEDDTPDSDIMALVYPYNTIEPIIPLFKK